MGNGLRRTVPMRFDETRNEGAANWGKPLDGVRVLSFEQYIALPFATQILARLGASVVKVELPGTGEAGRAGFPFVRDADGRQAGSSFTRYNLGKKSIALDYRSEAGRTLAYRLVRDSDVVCENLGPGRAEKMGLGYATLATMNPALVYLALSGFGQIGTSPYASRPAMAGVAEAMAGIYDFARVPGQPPIAGLAGPLGDTTTGAFAAIGVLAALQHRTAIGLGQLVDVSMFDSMLAVCDFLPNFWSIGVRKAPDKVLRSPGLIGVCRAADGWFTLYVLRAHQFERLSKLVGHLEWLTDPRLATPWDWADRMEDVLCPAIGAWAADKTKQEAVDLVCKAGIPAGACNTADDIVSDPHVAARGMLLEVPRDDGVDAPMLVAGMPVKMSRVTEGGETKQPLLGQHTDDVLREVLGADGGDLAAWRESGVIG